MAKKTTTSSSIPGFPGQFGLLAQQLYQGFGNAPASFTPAGSGLLEDPKATTGLLDFQNYVNNLYNYKDPRLEPEKPVVEKPPVKEPTKPPVKTPVKQPVVQNPYQSGNIYVPYQRHGNR